MKNESTLLTSNDQFPDTDMNTRDGKIFHYIRSNSTVLEFGPGYGRMTKYLKNVLGCKVYIVEIDRDAYESAIQFAAGGLCGNILDFRWIKKYDGISFDHIIIANVLEYLSDPCDVLDKSLSLLKNDGSVLLSVPNIAHNAVIINLIKNKFEYRDTGLLDKNQLRFFSHSSLLEMLESCSLVPVVQDGTICVPENTELRSTYTDLNGNAEILKTREFANVYQFVFKCIKRKFYIKNKDANIMQKLYDNTKISLFTCAVYLDTGSGFNQKEMVEVPLFRKDNRFEANITLSSGIKGIRFDPVEGSACIINNLKIITDKGVIEYTHTNGVMNDGIFLFNTVDPQITIEFSGNTYFHIRITGELYQFSFDDIGFLSKCEQVFKTINIQRTIAAERNDLLTERASLIAKHPEITSQTGILFFNTGSGYSIKEMLKYSFLGNEVAMSCQIPENTISIRLDPVEGYGCVISDLEILSYNGIIKYQPINGYSNGNEDIIFITTDPIIELTGAVYWLKIRYRILLLSEFLHYRILDNYIHTSQDRNNLITERNSLIAIRDAFTVERDSLTAERDSFEIAHNALVAERDGLVIERDDLVMERNRLVAMQNGLSAERDGLITERDGLVAERNGLVTERNSLEAKQNNLIVERNWLVTERDSLIHDRDWLVKSRSWRFTKPLRTLGAFIRRNRALYLFAKTVLSIKGNGIKATIKKVATYKQKKTQIQSIPLITETFLTDDERLSQVNTIFQKKVKFSIITPLYNTPKHFLWEMIESVMAQTYSNWELCLADGSDSEHGYVREICRMYVRKDKRFKYIKLKNNKGIAENTIEAFHLSNGDYIVLLDHDDLLTEDALFEVVKTINKNIDTDFIFSDRLVFDDKTKKILGRQYLPGFNPDLLRSFNYASHLNVFSLFIINKVGFEIAGYNGSQDYEFELRVVEAARNIIHIDKILYCCRASEESVATNPANKMYAYESGRRAVEEHITRIGYPGRVEFIEKTFSYRIHYDISNDEKVSIVILNRDKVELLSKCIDSILRNTTYPNYEIVIIENNSVLLETFLYYEQIAKANKDKVIVKNYGKLDEFNFSLLNNWGVQETKGKYLLFLNNDTQVLTPNWIEEMIMFAQREDVGVVGVMLYYPDNTVQHCGLIVGLGGHCASHYNQRALKGSFGYMHCLSMTRNYSAVTAACMMIKRQDFLDVGGFDEEQFKIGLNDVDVCLKLREKKKLIVFTPYAELYHFEGSSRGRDGDSACKKSRYLEEAKCFKEKWKKYFDEGDPYFYKNEY